VADERSYTNNQSLKREPSEIDIYLLGPCMSTGSNQAWLTKEDETCINTFSPHQTISHGSNLSWT